VAKTDSNPDWWRDAVVYQVYPRSFADGGGDGVGDLPGLISRLPHLVELGVDALWISPWYRSPMADAGYDVADYRDIDPLFGTLADATRLIDAAHGLGLRVIIDIVPNHCSDQHLWFQAALAAGPGSVERELFHFRPGLGPDGEQPPNDWPSMFGGPGWKRVIGPDGKPEEWYLHLFNEHQPDFNWDHPEVRAEFESILRFWLDRGVDGFRIDVANLLVKQKGLPSWGPLQAAGEPSPYEDRPEVHDVYRAWRRIADSYGEFGQTRIFVGELWVSPTSLKRYLRPDELHTGFNFPYLQAPWQPSVLRSIIDATLEIHAEVGAPATWVLGNHDVTRVVTRYGRTESGWSLDGVRVHDVPVDVELGTRRARAARCCTWRCPAARTSTRARSWGCGRSRTSRPNCVRTRRSSSPTGRTSGATAAGFRCRGRLMSRGSGSDRRVRQSPGFHSRLPGRSWPPTYRRRTPRRCSRFTVMRCGFDSQFSAI
jgi:alpha-glucosidase